MRPVIAARRNPWVLGLVVLAHGAVLWSLMHNVRHVTAPAPIPVTVFLEALTPPTPPQPRPAAEPARRATKAARAEEVAPLQRVAEAAPATASPAPAATLAEASAATPVAAPPAPVAPPAPPRIELPSSDADYLQNPKPPYPALSKRMGEQGQVILRVTVAADGSLLAAAVARSSGYPRLDEAALAAVRKWRFVPGKRNGMAATMDHDVPINFVLE
jgi:protein TonB